MPTINSSPLVVTKQKRNKHKVLIFGDASTLRYEGLRRKGMVRRASPLRYDVAIATGTLKPIQNANGKFESPCRN